MFYDERIEKVKARLAQNAILITFCYSLCYGGVRLFNILRNTDGICYLSLVSIELFAVLTCGLTLLIGALKGAAREKDERFHLEQNAFYLKAARRLLLLLPAVFSLFLPYVTLLDRPALFADSGFGTVFVTLFLVLGAYTVLTFRKNDVYFNYSLMETESYCSGVFQNIGKLALATLGYSLLALVATAVTALSERLSLQVILPLIFDILFTYNKRCYALAAIYCIHAVPRLKLCHIFQR